MHRWLLFVCVALVLTGTFNSTAQTTAPAPVPEMADPGFTTALFTNALTYGPTALQFAPDGRLFVAQQNGIVKVFDTSGTFLADFATVTTDTTQERGLLGLAFHPGFATTDPYLYVHYTVPGTDSTDPFGRISRFAASMDNPNVSTGMEEVIFELDPLTNTATHNGGAIHFGLDDMLYIATGDNRLPLIAQDMNSTHGKILRISEDGTIPMDNPFYDTAVGDYRAIWALGMRNPYTFAIEPGTGFLYVNDVGENSFEEVSRVDGGNNYGWPYFEGDAPGDFAPPPGFTSEPPIITYAHGTNTVDGCSISGGVFYTNAVYPVPYQYNYYYADFCAGWIRRYDPGMDTSSDFLTGLGNYGPVDIALSPGGEIYYATRTDDAVYRVIYNALALTSPAGIISDGYGNPTYQWPALEGTDTYTLNVVDAAMQTVFEIVVDAGDVCDPAVCSVDATTYTEDARLYNGDYNVYLQAGGGDAPDNWVGPFAFTLSAAAPDMATLAMTTDTDTTTPTLNWDLPGTAANATFFQLYIAPDADLGNPAFFDWVSRADACGDVDATACAYASPVTLNSNTTYQLWMQSAGPGGQSDWAGPETFTVAEVAPPPAPSNVNAVPNNGRPTISWDANADSLWYQVWVGDDTGATAYLQWHEASTICDPTICLLDVDLIGGDYITYVQAWGQGGFSVGGTAGWGGPANFSLSSTAPAEPGNLTAAYDAGMTELTLNWNSVENGTWYNVWVGTSGDFQQVHFEWHLGESMGCAFGMATCVLTLDLDLAADDYTSFVQVWGPGGFSDWVEGMTFTVIP